MHSVCQIYRHVYIYMNISTLTHSKENEREKFEPLNVARLIMYTKALSQFVRIQTNVASQLSTRAKRITNTRKMYDIMSTPQSKSVDSETNGVELS